MGKEVTVVTMYRGDGEIFVQVVEGTLTDEQKAEWRKTHKCNEFYPEDWDEDDQNSMGFRTLSVLGPGTADLLHAGI